MPKTGDYEDKINKKRMSGEEKQCSDLKENTSDGHMLREESKGGDGRGWRGRRRGEGDAKRANVAIIMVSKRLNSRNVSEAFYEKTTFAK